MCRRSQEAASQRDYSPSAKTQPTPHQQHLGKTEEVLIEGPSKKSADHWMGRNSQNTVVVFEKEHYKVGDYVDVFIENCTSATLLGKAVGYGKNQVDA